jgi:hypothetical protein
MVLSLKKKNPSSFPFFCDGKHRRGENAAAAFSPLLCFPSHCFLCIAHFAAFHQSHMEVDAYQMEVKGADNCCMVVCEQCSLGPWHPRGTRKGSTRTAQYMTKIIAGPVPRKLSRSALLLPIRTLAPLAMLPPRAALWGYRHPPTPPTPTAFKHLRAAATFDLWSVLTVGDESL